MKPDKLLTLGAVLFAAEALGKKPHSKAHSTAGKPIMYWSKHCKGEQQVIEPDNGCSSLSSDLLFSVNGAYVPGGIVCDFYSDKFCKTPLWIGMEDPGDCNFSDLEIDNKAGGVLCYRAEEIEVEELR